MNTKLIGSAFVAIAVIAGVYSYMSSSMNAKEIMMKEGEAKKMEAAKMAEAKVAEEKMMMEKEAMMKDGKMMEGKIQDKMMKDEKGAMVDNKMMMEKVGMYAPYSPEKIAMAATGDVVLFFKASWCPKCRTTDADIKANLKNIPAEVTILEVDYDKSTDLKVKYGVTSQHTFVQVNAKGDALSKWSGSNTLKELVANIK